MKEDEDIETMYSRFQTLVFGLHVLNKSYFVPDHVKKIIRSLSARFRQTTIQEARDLNKLSLENLISYLKSHEIELIEDEPAKKSKSIALTFKENLLNLFKLLSQKKWRKGKSAKSIDLTSKGKS